VADRCLKIATCQFAVGSSISGNSRAIREFMEKASEAGAVVVHFPECALSGYAGTDFASFKGYDWDLLKKHTEQIIALAAELKLWVILGSMHLLTQPNSPHNSLYIISDEGEIVDRYDKRFCTNKEQKLFTAGNHFAYFNINGVKCTALICFDVRFPEVYRELLKAGVNCIFQSFYNARQAGPSVHTDIMRQSMQCRAATNYFWASMSNSSAYYSPYPSCFIRPDGKIVKQLDFNKPGMMVNTVDLSREYYDPSRRFRDRVLDGQLNNALQDIDDPRSKCRTEL